MNKIRIILQYILPKRLLTKLIGWAAELHGGLFTRWAIMLFIRWYKIDMHEAQYSNITDYSTFNAFFTRSLRNEVRYINNNSNILIFPADGVISQFGSIEGEHLFQIKGHKYSLKALLAGHEFMTNQFYNGNFITIYISPKNYHRVHMPCNGILREMLYIPGQLFSLNKVTTKNISNLFARNERIICLFNTNFGPMVQILVGAIIVGSIETVWAGTIIPPRKRVIQHWYYPELNSNRAITLCKGQEMGRFKLGSTVINLFTQNKVSFAKNLHIDYITYVGQQLGHGITTYQKNNYQLI